VTASNLAGKWSAWAPQLRSVLRIAAAFVFMQSGTMKLFGFPMAMPDGKTATLLTQVGIAGILEVFGGGLLHFISGVCDRPASR